MEVKTLVVGQMQVNCYLLIDVSTNLVVIIDPGDDADLITQTIIEAGLKVGAVLATHGHFDHIMAAFELQLNFDVPFYIHGSDRFLLTRMQETADFFIPGVECPPPPQQVIELNEGELVLSGMELTVISTPGHTPGSVSIYIPADKKLFSGDVIFANGGIGRTDFHYCNALTLNDSLHKLMGLDDDVTIYPGHGAATTVGGERKFWKLT